jgi:uncharacterized BrkB/YihY/UPF0761 family membrane protein
MLLTAGLAAFGRHIGTLVPESLLQIAGFLASFLVISLLFAMMFKWLSDAEVRWSDVWLGAIGTAALFEVGKFAISFYIGKQGLESAYGAAASLVVVLIWVYFSAQIVLFGAELTNATAKDAPGLLIEPIDRGVLWHDTTECFGAAETCWVCRRARFHRCLSNCGRLKDSAPALVQQPRTRGSRLPSVI